MKANSSMVLMLSLGCVWFVSVARQDESPAVPDLKLDQDVAERVDLLEQRVGYLETILFSTVKLEAKRAERQLEERKVRLQDSRELFARGMITELQLRFDRNRVDEARQELALAVSFSNQRRLVCELGVHDAVRTLALAVQQLRYQENRARRGFATIEQVERMEELVVEATQGLEHARTKLEAAEKLDAIDKE